MQDYSEPQDEEKLARNNPLGEAGRPPNHAEWVDPIIVDGLAAVTSILIIMLMVTIILL